MPIKWHIVALALVCLHWLPGFQRTASAQSDREEILKARAASNAALADFDNEQSYTFLTDDVLITTGNGTLLRGKDELRKYVSAATDPPMYWVRTAESVEVNHERLLAWEIGTWKGYRPTEGSEPVIGGRYSAQWTKEDGNWKIRSQLFVTLFE